MLNNIILTYTLWFPQIWLVNNPDTWLRQSNQNFELNYSNHPITSLTIILGNHNTVMINWWWDFVQCQSVIIPMINKLYPHLLLSLLLFLKQSFQSMNGLLYASFDRLHVYRTYKNEHEHHGNQVGATCHPHADKAEVVTSNHIPQVACNECKIPNVIHQVLPTQVTQQRQYNAQYLLCNSPSVGNI